ncbi:MAG: tetratricopeptide repeat protein [Gemmatimonadetes bacterium]|nr:tetratricopeptide repeat protein [Gemmatimonadota bacterium]
MSNLSILPALAVLLMHFTWQPSFAGQDAESISGQDAESLAARAAESLLDQARVLYDQGEFQRAESTLRMLLERQPELPAAHLWLSRTLDRMERYDEAEEAAKEALKVDSTSPEILIQLARVNMLKDKKTDARDYLDEAEKLAPDMADIYYYRGRTYGKLRMALFRPRTAEREYRIQDASYRRAVALNPSHPDAYFQLGYVIEEIQDDPESAMDWYVRQASVNPAHDEAVYRLAACAVELRAYQKGYAQLQRVATTQDSAVNPLVEGLAAQLEAYRYHTLDQHVRAYRAMRRYVAVLSEIDPGKVALFKDLSIVASSKEADAFLEAPEKEREQLWRTYWAARDPDPTTRINERLVEHYRRMIFSRLHFSAGKTPWDRRGEIYVRYGHPDDRQQFILKSGEDVVNAIFPTGMQAVDMIRETSRQRLDMQVSTGAPIQDFGEFSARIGRETKSVAFPTESWVYVPFGLEIFFTDQRNSKAFDYPLEVIDLPDQATNFGTTDRLAYSFLNTPRKQAEELIRKVPESHRYDYGGEPLSFVYQLASFKGAGDWADVEVAYSLPAAQLGNVEDGLGERTWLSGRIALQDQDFNYVQAMPFRMGPLRRPESAQDNLQLSTGAFRFSAQPGAYRSAVSLRDSLSQKFGIFTAPLRISDYSSDRMLLSDVKLAASIVPTDAAGLLIRNGLFITPHPARLYSRATPVFIYYEIYNLEPDAEGRTGFRTELEIAAREPRRNVVLRFLTALGRMVSQRSDDQTAYVTFEDSGTSPDDFKYTSIETADLDPGTYTMTLTVTDLHSGQQDTKTVDFIVVQG